MTPETTSPVADAPQSRLPRRLWQWIYTHNPFYLLSVCFVLHGASFWMQNAGVYRSWPLIGVVSGYILLLAIVAFVIVRAGQVWDDARSILLIILILFVELSLTFDDPLLSASRIGIPLVLAGFLFAVAMSEGLLWGLRIRLPASLRLPFHGLLALMMLYPLAVTPGTQTLTADQISWRIYGFFPLAGLLVLTLIPAVRRQAGHVRNSGTPWPWPWYPWTIFAVLLAGVCVRGYALSLSFDPVLSLGKEAAMRLETAWGWYFLVPVLLAVGWLILEFGQVLQKDKLLRIALLFPFAAFGLSIPQFTASIPHVEFLKEFTGSIASPIFVSLMGAVAFYTLAFIRRVPLSDVGLALALCLSAIVGPETVNWKTITSPEVSWLALASIFLVLRGWLIHRSLPTLAGLLIVVAALRLMLPEEWGTFWRNALCLHLVGLAVIVVAIVFHDAISKALRHLGALFLLGGSVFALYGSAYHPPVLAWWIVPLYVGGLIVVSFALAYWIGSRAFFAAGSLGIILGASASLREGYHVLHTLPEWPGIASFTLAFLLLAAGGLISAAKAGLLDRLKTYLPRSRLNGPAES